MAYLALLGGTPTRTESWPTWPKADENTERLLREVLFSGRWAISGMYGGRAPFERQLAEQFADYIGVGYCVPVCNGSAALVVGLQALGVEYGDEVLVPGLVWVACASAVARIGAIPILVDVEPETLCMSVEAAERMISPNTRAIMIVHLYCGMSDLDRFANLSSSSGLPILEDCSQAHGARWNGRAAGSFGQVGAFSTQDSKLLTSGEGGLTVTSDPELYSRLQQLRADGRLYQSAAPQLNYPDLEETGAVQGHNYCMSEFQAAVLLDRLRHLDEENSIRESNVSYLRRLLAEIGDVTPLQRLPQVTTATYYHLCVRINRAAFAGAPIELLRRALMAELGVFMEPIDDPLNRNRLYNPLLSPRTSDEHRPLLDPSRFVLPEADRARDECLTFPHFAFLSNRQAMDQIAEAFAKVRQHRHELESISLS